MKNLTNKKIKEKYFSSYNDKQTEKAENETKKKDREEQNWLSYYDLN
jgi:hypothetical protein